MSSTPSDSAVQGEGDYIAGRRFQDAEQAFVKAEPVAEKAREAADALSGPEAAELEAARRSSAGGDIHHRQPGPEQEPSMSLDIHDKAEVEKRLWRELEDSRFGMLGAVGGQAGHFNPMTAFPEPESGGIWFYASRESHLARAAETGTPAMFIVMSKDRDLQACIGGDLRATFDSLHRDKFWSPMVAAWFPKGKNDPSLVLLHLTCRDAEVWVSDAGPLKVGWEIAKANLTGSTPDIGAHTHLKLG